MIGDAHTLTPGYVQRHIPPASGIGLDIAVLDIAQDFLLAHLEERGIFENLAVFKGGTALRKLYAGRQGRFSTDLDLAAREPGGDREVLASLIADEAQVSLGPFRFEADCHRGRWHINVRSPFANPVISIKLDVGPPCWLQPERRSFVEHPTQSRYGFALPRLPCARLEEILAEKVARLCRRGTARDASDPLWAATTAPYSGFSRNAVRALAVLKVWVDNHGLSPDWAPAQASRPFEPERWFAPRDGWDDEQIGLLATPPPTLEQLEEGLQQRYAWLTELTETEVRLARAHAGNRGEVIAAVKELDGSNLADVHLW